MKLINSTNWNSAQVKAIVRKVAEIEQLTPDEIGRLIVELRYRKRSHRRADEYSGGYGYYNSMHFVLKVVKGVPQDKVVFARVIAHELAHNQGVHHGKAMKGADYGWGEGWKEKWSWAEAMPLEMNPEPKKLSKTAGSKMIHCLEQLVSWERKAKLARTKIRKLTLRVRYYQKKLAAMPATPKLAVESPSEITENKVVVS